jgi:hypothetical protein
LAQFTLPWWLDTSIPGTVASVPIDAGFWSPFAVVVPV